MSVEVRVPEIGESITEVQIGSWLKQEGDPVTLDEPVVVIETDKATVELPSPATGRLGKILKGTGDRVPVGEVIATVEEAAVQGDAASGRVEPPSAQAPEAPAQPTPAAEPRVMPAAARAAAQAGLDPLQVTPTGPGARVLKEDVDRAVAERAAQAKAARADPAQGDAAGRAPAPAAAATATREDEVVPMTPIRRRIAERLVSAKRDMALLTTFNEIDMSAVMALRKQRGEAFQARHGVKLGFTSFFVKAVVDGLKRIPQLNAEIRGEDLVFHNYYDVGVAVGGGKGLVVPVIRNADRLSFAEVEKTVEDFGKRARENKLDLDEIRGGTFTISNGGVYGSLLSTPIVNPPQSGVLGLHAIQERPVVRDGQIVARPMMYVALTYDHRIVDGREAVTFLKHVKDAVEDPAVLLLEL